MKCVLCLSGGLDSVTLLYKLKAEDADIRAVLFNYQQRHVRELECARWHCERTGTSFITLEIPSLKGSQLTDGSGSWIVPNRNAILLSVAVNVAVDCGADWVFIGCNKGDAEAFPDCRPEFIAAYNKTLEAAEINVRVQAPFVTRSKAWIARLASDIGIRRDTIWTCYQGGAEPCGSCPACEKLEGAYR